MGVILESNDSIGPVWPLLYSSLVSYLLRANTKAGDSAKQVIVINIFPRFASVTRFPVLGNSNMSSRALHRMHVFASCSG